MKKTLITLLLATACIGICRADEGMWLPSLIGKNIKDMHTKGFKLTAEDIYSVNKASMKDAVVKFGNGCSAELISAQGLLLTNHHCGYGEIQKHSSLEHDYLTNGFWAMSKTEELPNPGLTVTFLVRMDDVTTAVLEGVSDTMSPKDKIAFMDANKKALVQKATAGTHYSAAVESFYYGNQYFLFIYEVYEDVRLVAAPPSAIGKFGGDTDNWMWPRHTGDFSLFRIYAGPDNKPAKYSRDNVPYVPKKHFAISTKGINEGDFTFVYGLPAYTYEYIISDAVDYVLNVANPVKIELRTMRLDEIKSASDADPRIRIQYAAKTANIANAWKKWQGESKGLARLKTIERKQMEEAAFEKWAASLPKSNPNAAAYRQVLPELRRLYASLRGIAFARDMYNEAFGAIELTKFATTLIGGKYSDEDIEDFYKNYSPAIDRRIATKVLKEYLDKVPREFWPEGAEAVIDRAGGIKVVVDWFFENSDLTSISRLDTADKERLKMLANPDSQDADIAVIVADLFGDIYAKKIAPKYKALNDSIQSLYSVYMRGLMEQQPARNFYPDANFTLRVAYGRVAGYKPEDGMKALHYTTIEGIMEKDNPEIYDYDVPARLKEVYKTKDYGRWAIKEKQDWDTAVSSTTVPVAFLATNHTSGGNSGSPVLNSSGELIGLNFDRTWLSTMSDIEFDPAMCRNISVDIRYVLFVVDKVGGAGYLLNEMTFAK